MAFRLNPRSRSDCHQETMTTMTSLSVSPVLKCVRVLFPQPVPFPLPSSLAPSSTRLALFLQGGNGGNKVFSGSALGGEWHFAVMAYSPLTGAVAVYIDGILASSYTSGSIPSRKCVLLSFPPFSSWPARCVKKDNDGCLPCLVMATTIPVLVTGLMVDQPLCTQFKPILSRISSLGR